MKTVLHGLIDLIYPPVCLLCRRDIEDSGETEKTSTALCVECRKGLKPLEPPFCPRCGEAVTRFRDFCEECERGDVFPFVWRQAAGHYQGNLRQAIALFKYAGKGALAEPLGQFLVDSLKSRAIPLAQSETGERQQWTVVPVPLHPARFRERGFNQAERLARVLAREMDWPLNTSDLRRTRKTSKQAGITEREKRRKNVADAFEAAHPEAFSGRSVLLIDDVMTTLSTLRECTIAVKNAGAERAALLTLARG